MEVEGLVLNSIEIYLFKTIEIEHRGTLRLVL